MASRGDFQDQDLRRLLTYVDCRQEACNDDEARFRVHALGESECRRRGVAGADDVDSDGGYTCNFTGGLKLKTAGDAFLDVTRLVPSSSLHVVFARTCCAAPRHTGLTFQSERSTQRCRGGCQANDEHHQQVLAVSRR